MAVKCVVLDFDGTFTDADAEAVGFVRVFPSLVEGALGRPLGSLWGEAAAAVQQGAPEDGWMMDGVASAPADADPYIRAACTAQHVFDRLGVLQDFTQRSHVMQAIYQQAYAHSSTVMRPEVKPVVEELLRRGLPVYVITNATSDVAIRKLATLGLALPVMGDARKFLICPTATPHAGFEALPAVQQVEGLKRGMQLKRGAYLDALGRVWSETGVSSEETLVCGDIHELDLALPAALGCMVHLLERPTTHAYERHAVQELGARGGFSRGMTALLTRL